MMGEAAPIGRPPIMKRLFQSIENEAGMCRLLLARQPTILLSVGIDDEGDVDKPSLGAT